jgi:hypothetical protein
MRPSKQHQTCSWQRYCSSSATRHPALDRPSRLDSRSRRAQAQMNGRCTRHPDAGVPARQRCSPGGQDHLDGHQVRRADQIICAAKAAITYQHSRDSYSAVWSISRRPAMHGALARWWHSVTGPGGYAVEEELLDHSPAAHVRRPRPLSRGLRPVVTRARLAFLWVEGFDSCAEFVRLRRAGGRQRDADRCGVR